MGDTSNADACCMGTSCSPAPTGKGFDSSWDNLGPYLEELDLDGAQLPFQLPASWGQAWRGVNFISIARAGLVSTLPREWGVNGAFPILKRIWLYNNPSLTGEGSNLPLFWQEMGPLNLCLLLSQLETRKQGVDRSCTHQPCWMCYCAGGPDREQQTVVQNTSAAGQ